MTSPLSRSDRLHRQDRDRSDLRLGHPGHQQIRGKQVEEPVRTTHSVLTFTGDKSSWRGQAAAAIGLARCPVIADSYALAETIGRIVGIEPEINFGLPRSGEVRVSLGDPSRANRELSFIVRTSLENGLKSTLQ